MVKKNQKCREWVVHGQDMNCVWGRDDTVEQDGSKMAEELKRDGKIIPDEEMTQAVLNGLSYYYIGIPLI